MTDSTMTPTLGRSGAPAPRARGVLSATARRRNESFRRQLNFELAVMRGLRKRVAEGHTVKTYPLGAYPAAAELVRELARRLAERRSYPDRMTYRGVSVYVEVSGFGRVFVTTLDGEPIGASGFGAVWSD